MEMRRRTRMMATRIVMVSPALMGGSVNGEQYSKTHHKQDLRRRWLPKLSPLALLLAAELCVYTTLKQSVSAVGLLSERTSFAQLALQVDKRVKWCFATLCPVKVRITFIAWTLRSPRFRAGGGCAPATMRRIRCKVGHI
jgi:hypothetical protein